MSEIEVAPNESDVQSAIIEITTKRITDLTNQSILLEANLLACQNNLRLQVNASKDVSSELNTFKESHVSKLEQSEKENIELKLELDELKSEYKDADRRANILSGKKDEVKELNKNLAEITSKYEVVKQERADLASKIESGYKVQIRELKEKLEAVNGNNNTVKEKSG